MRNRTRINRTRKNRTRQLDMFSGSDYARRVIHGGETRKGRRKLARPIVTKAPMHVVMRASRAYGEWSLLREKNYNLVSGILRKMSRKYDIRIRHFVNVGNHLHLVLQAKTRESLSNFMREFAGTVAMRVTGAKKGSGVATIRKNYSPTGFFERFWDATYFSRVITWGRDLRGMVSYVVKNFIESRTGFWVSVDEIIEGRRLGFG